MLIIVLICKVMFLIPKHNDENIVLFKKLIKAGKLS